MLNKKMSPLNRTIIDEFDSKEELIDGSPLF